MKLKLERYGDDCILVLPPHLVEKFRLDDGGELFATVHDDGSLTISAGDAAQDGAAD